MSFTILDVPQRSPEWHQARCGRLTGTAAADMLATIKTGEAAARRDLRMRLVCERLTHVSQENGYVNTEMQRGIDCEPLACAAYEALTGNAVQSCGFLQHTELMAGCSIDGYVGDMEGIVELKCPKSATHLRYLCAGVAPKEHLPQIVHNLWVSGAAWCDFLSWDDRFPEPLQVTLIRVTRNDQAIADYEKIVRAFLAEVDREYDAIRTMTNLSTVLQEATA